MKRLLASYAVFLSAICFHPASPFASPAAADLPKVNGKPVVARINGEPLMLEEFMREFTGIHGMTGDNASTTATRPSELLDRLVNARLILQEARNIGLDELPEMQSARKAFEEETLRRMVYSYHVRDVVKPDPKEAEKRYREAVKEVKVASVLFDKQEDAKKMEAEIKAGKRFGDLAKKALASGKAKGGTDAQHLKFASLSPDVARAVASMKKGEASPVIPVGDKFALLKLEGVRYPDDKAAREQAEKDALQAKKNAMLQKFSDGLRKKYAAVDKKLFDGLDYDSSKPGLEKLRADQRLVVKLKGDKPVTVAEFTAALEKKFFHGAERAMEGGKINRKKGLVLEEILSRRVAILEARNQKLDRTAFFQEKIRENDASLLFGMFVRKVIVPDLKVSEEESKAYYNKHIDRYTYPAMVRIDGLMFSDRGNAQDVIEKLRKGADYKWVHANAEGQVDHGKAKNLLEFEGQPVEVSSLPEGVKKAISGTSAGDYRLYADPSGVHYVLHLLERIPSRPIPIDSLKADIEKMVFTEKLKRVLADWEGKLRKASDVKIYATGKKLDQIVASGAR